MAQNIIPEHDHFARQETIRFNEVFELQRPKN